MLASQVPPTVDRASYITKSRSLPSSSAYLYCSLWAIIIPEKPAPMIAHRSFFVGVKAGTSLRGTLIRSMYSERGCALAGGIPFVPFASFRSASRSLGASPLSIPSSFPPECTIMTSERGQCSNFGCAKRGLERRSTRNIRPFCRRYALLPATSATTAMKLTDHGGASMYFNPNVSFARR